MVLILSRAPSLDILMVFVADCITTRRSDSNLSQSPSRWVRASDDGPKVVRTGAASAAADDDDPVIIALLMRPAVGGNRTREIGTRWRLGGRR